MAIERAGSDACLFANGEFATEPLIEDRDRGEAAMKGLSVIPLAEADDPDRA